MKRILLLQLILACSITVFSQSTSFFKKYGDFGVSESGTGIIQLPSGTVFISGVESKGIGGSRDVFVMKLDADGEVLDKWIYGTADNEYANSLQLVDNELVIVGETSNNLGTKKTGFILRVDTLGNELFFESYEKANDNLTFSDGYFDGKNYLVTGFVSGSGFGNDIYVAQISADSTENWEYIFGDTLNEVANSIKEFSNGTVVITCDKQREDGLYNVFSMCFDKKGNVLWQNDVTTRKNGGSKKMLINSAGNAFMFGEMSTPTSPAFDMYFVEISPDGALVQAGWVPGSDDHSDAAFGGCEIMPGHYLLTGFGYNPASDQSDLPVVSVNPDGKLIERKYYGGDQFEIGYAIIPAISGGFLVTGNTNENGDVQLVLGHDDISTVLNSENISSSKTKIVNSVFKNGSDVTVRLNAIHDLKKVHFFDANGVSLYFDDMNSPTDEISFSKNISSGIYFIKFELNTGQVLTEKVFIF